MCCVRAGRCEYVCVGWTMALAASTGSSREMEKPNESGYSLKSLPRRVLFPEPEGPATTRGRGWPVVCSIRLVEKAMVVDGKGLQTIIHV